MRKQQIQRPRHSAEIQGIDEQRRRADLPAPVRSEKAPKLLLGRPPSPRRLFLEGAKRVEVTQSADDLLDGVGAEGADQLVLQVRDADVEAQCFPIRASQARSEAGPLEGPLEVVLLCRVTEARQLEVEAPRAVQIQVAADGLCTSDRDDGNTLGVQVSTCRSASASTAGR